MTYPGIYRGTCYDNSDPERRGRLRALVPQLLGQTPLDWAWPVRRPGEENFTYDQSGYMFEVPVGTGLWVMFEGGDIDYPVWIGTW